MPLGSIGQGARLLHHVDVRLNPAAPQPIYHVLLLFVAVTVQVRQEPVQPDRLGSTVQEIDIAVVVRGRGVQLDGTVESAAIEQVIDPLLRGLIGT